MHILLLFTTCFLLLSSTSCTHWFRAPPPIPAEVFDSAEVTSVVQEFSVEVEHEKNMHLQKAHTYFNNGIHTIALEFISQSLIEMCDARKLIVDMTESLLGKLNQDYILGPEFSNFPFRPSNLEIYITFESFFGRYVDPYYIAWIGMEDGHISYYIFDPLDNSKNCWHGRHEAYATSREIVVYERQAEQKFEEVHKVDHSVFGNIRYYPQ